MAVTLNWPAGVPYEPLIDGYTVNQLYDEQLMSQMEGGNARRRPRYTMNYRQQQIVLHMSAAQVRRFEDWLVNDCRRGTQRFNMPVWKLGRWESRVCLIQNGTGPQITPYGYINGELAYRVQITIASEES